MSTILDALRKLEEEQQSRTADARSRLLQPSIYRSRLARRQQSRWKSNAGLLGILAFVVAGFAAGGGMMWWRSESRTTPESVASLPSPNTIEKARAVNTPALLPQETPSSKRSIEEKRPPETPTSQLQIAERQPAETVTPSAAFPNRQDNQPPALPESMSSAPAGAEAPLPSVVSSAKDAEDAALTEAPVIHHSPFVISSPAPREAATKTRTASTPPVSPTPPSTNTAAVRPEVHRPTLAPLPQASHFGAVRPDQQEGESSSASVATLSLLQWSSDPERRIAFLRVNGGPLTMAHEGDTVGGYKVAEIRQNAVELQLGETHLTLRVR
ncbi:MAG: hypothetical protein HY267_00235 [Deltaproteobacteria bacterium]|nr:hypothetical protein [Deltaproteobacteria bacterium]